MSLILELTELVSVPPHLAEDREERRYLVSAILEELSTRGFGKEDLRLIVVKRASVMVWAWVVIAKIVDATRGEDSPGEEEDVSDVFAFPEDWSKLAASVEVTIDPETQSITVFDRVDTISSVLPALISWNLGQEIDAIVEWSNTPPASYISSYAGEGFNWEIFSTADWLVDRFTKTYLSDWKVQSLDLEWRYIHSQQVGCSPPAQMQLRRVKLADVAAEIASRAVEERNSSRSKRHRIQPADFVETATSLLAAKRYESAAAMFEALRKIDPTHPELANNLAFCLMPTHPDRALELLEEATRLSEPGAVSPIIWANKVATLYLLNRDDEALAEIAAGAATGTGSAWLWEINEEREVEHVASDVSIPAYVMDLGSRLTGVVGPQDSGGIDQAPESL